jgi:hypothetical protein
MSILSILQLGSAVNQTSRLGLIGPRVLVVVGLSVGLLATRDAWRLLRSNSATA